MNFASDDAVEEDNFAKVNASFLLKTTIDNKISSDTYPNDQIDGQKQSSERRCNDKQIYSANLEISEDFYNMNHSNRGHCVIFNQKTFDGQLCLGKRSGTDEDCESAYHLFEALGFKVKVYNDLTDKGIEKKINKYAYKIDHSDCDCIVIMILSHGKSGFLYGKNKPFKSEHLFENFTANNCPSLASKPKMFFIQACRGEELDFGFDLFYQDSRDEVDGVSIASNTGCKIPNFADFLVCWSTVADHVSWRDRETGSWFIQSLVNIFNRYVNTMDVMSMMTLVNKYMTENFELKRPGVETKIKQCCCTVSSLMRLVYLKPKSRIGFQQHFSRVSYSDSCDNDSGASGRELI